jgi:hypothetical protein
LIADLGPDLGLELNLVKNEVVFFWDDSPDPFPKEVERFRDGFELLGSPIGDAAFCRKHIGKFTAKAVAHTLGPSSLDDPQVFICCSACEHRSAASCTCWGLCQPYAREAIPEFDRLRSAEGAAARRRRAFRRAGAATAAPIQHQKNRRHEFKKPKKRTTNL